jgi:hypothetical protein
MVLSLREIRDECLHPPAQVLHCNRNVGIKLLLRLCAFVQVEQNDAILPTN